MKPGNENIKLDDSESSIDTIVGVQPEFNASQDKRKTMVLLLQSPTTGKLQRCTSPPVKQRESEDHLPINSTIDNGTPHSESKHSFKPKHPIIGPMVDTHLKSKLILDMQGKDYIEIPYDQIPNINIIRELDLRNNRIARIDNDITKIECLRCLKCNSNMIRSINEGIGQLTKLKDLFLDNNLLSCLPVEIGNCTGLTTLSLSSNKLSALPETIGKLVHLKTFHLHSNEFKTMPTTMFELIFLEDFSHDWITYLTINHTNRTHCKNSDMILLHMKTMCIQLRNKKTKEFTILEFMDFYYDQFNKKWPRCIFGAKKRTVLHIAAVQGDLSIFQLIMQRYSEINKSDSEGCNPLMLAIKYSNSTICDFIISKKEVNFNQVCRYGTALHMAILKQSFEIAMKMLSTRQVDPNLKDINGNTALHAVFRDFDTKMQQNEKMAGMLIDLKANINDENKFGLTPLMYAAKKGQIGALQFAFKYNENNIKNSTFRFEQANQKTKWTLLHYAARCNSYKVIKYLLEKGFNPLKADSNGKRASDVAFAFTHISKVLKKREKEYFSAKFGKFTYYSQQLKTTMNTYNPKHDYSSYYSKKMPGKSSRELPPHCRTPSTGSYMNKKISFIHDDMVFRVNYSNAVEQIGLRPFLEQNMVIKGKNRESMKAILSDVTSGSIKYQLLYHIFQRCDELSLRMLLNASSLDPLLSMDAIYLIGFFVAMQNIHAIVDISKHTDILVKKKEIHNSAWHLFASVFEYCPSYLSAMYNEDMSEASISDPNLEGFIKEMKVRNAKKYFNN